MSFQYQIKIKIKLVEINLSFLFTIQDVYVYVFANWSSCLGNHSDQTLVHMNFFWCFADRASQYNLSN